jgi:hypothetical protein
MKGQLSKPSFLAKCKRDFSNGTFLVIEYDTDIPVPKWVLYPISFFLGLRYLRRPDLLKLTSSPSGLHPMVGIQCMPLLSTKQALC